MTCIALPSADEIIARTMAEAAGVRRRLSGL